jgi:hypothetical protein
MRWENIIPDDWEPPIEKIENNEMYQFLSFMIYLNNSLWELEVEKPIIIAEETFQLQQFAKVMTLLYEEAAVQEAEKTCLSLNPTSPNINPEYSNELVNFEPDVEKPIVLPIQLFEFITVIPLCVKILEESLKSNEELKFIIRKSTYLKDSITVKQPLVWINDLPRTTHYNIFEIRERLFERLIHAKQNKYKLNFINGRKSGQCNVNNENKPKIKLKKHIRFKILQITNFNIIQIIQQIRKLGDNRFRPKTLIPITIKLNNLQFEIQLCFRTIDNNTHIIVTIHKIIINQAKIPVTIYLHKLLNCKHQYKGHLDLLLRKLNLIAVAAANTLSNSTNHKNNLVTNCNFEPRHTNNYPKNLIDESPKFKSKSKISNNSMINLDPLGYLSNVIIPTRAFMIQTKICTQTFT